MYADIEERNASLLRHVPFILTTELKQTEAEEEMSLRSNRWYLWLLRCSLGFVTCINAVLVKHNIKEHLSSDL